MKMFTTLMLLSLSAVSFASDIVVTSVDCTYTVTKTPKEIEIKVEVNNPTSSMSWWRFELPSNQVTLPLQENLNIRVEGFNDDYSTITYKKGVLVSDERLYSNFTRDTLKIEVSSDLEVIKSASYVRKGILIPMKHEKFKCKF